MKALRVILRSGKRILISTMLVSAFFVLIQDFLIFPGLWGYYFRWGVGPSIPKNEIRHEIKSADGTDIEVYELKVSKAARPYAAIIFHGNGEPAAKFAAFQQWLATLGISSYMVEYRGYGHSGGWPSENGLYADAAAAWDFVSGREKLQPENMIVVGYSIGTGPAAWLAANRKPAALVLFAAYSSLIERAAEEPLLGRIAPFFLHYKFPSASYLASLTDTCVVLAHGKRDTVIGFHHQNRLFKALKAGVKVKVVDSETAGHNDLLYLAERKVSEALLSCLK